MSTAIRAFYYENTGRLEMCFFAVIAGTSLRPQVARGIAKPRARRMMNGFFATRCVQVPSITFRQTSRSNVKQ